MENSNMLKSYSPSEMLNLWKTIMHLEPVRRECTIERDDGIDLDALLQLHIDQWYAHLLTTAQPEWLPIADVKASVALSIDGSGVVTATVPPQCVRPVEWRLDGWACSVTRFISPGDPEASVQHNEWTRAASQQPAIIDYGDHLQLCSGVAGTTPTLATARCVVRPADGCYIFHQAAIATIPDWEKSRPALL